MTPLQHLLGLLLLGKVSANTVIVLVVYLAILARGSANTFRFF